MIFLVFILGITACEQEFITPLLGPIDKNIHKHFLNLKPHFAIAISLDILYSGYWNNNQNYVNVKADSVIIVSQTKIKSPQFKIPSSYCQSDLKPSFLAQGYQTVTAKIQHTQLELLIEFESTFACKPQGCEVLSFKNLILDIYECHQSCLTCSGPNQNDCSTCPQGTPNNGVCSCNQLINFENKCLNICPDYYYSKDGVCQQDCPTLCSKCDSHVCTQCLSPYLLEGGNCVVKCSFNMYQNGNICKDIKEQAVYGADYLNKYFYSGSHFYEDMLKFLYKSSSDSKNSLLSTQLYSTFQDQIMLGGWSVFSDGAIQFSYAEIPAHYYLRIKLTAIFIDNWNGENIIIELDNQVIYQQSITTTTNFIQLDQPDLTQDIDIRIKHVKNTATFSINPQVNIPSYEASVGLFNLIVLYEKCNEILEEYECSSCKVPLSFLKGYCVTNLSKYYRNPDTTCITGYHDITSVLQCGKCYDHCTTCTAYSECTECQIPYNGLPACSNCIEGYYKSGNLCLQCSSNCKLCDEYEICVQCFIGYYLDDNYKCQPCSSHCIQCNRSECLQCEPYYYNVNNNCQMCGTGFLIIDSKCLQCNQRCLVCEDQQDNCLYCSQLRTNPPYCGCQYGYFEDENKTCSSQCSQCENKATNCITCVANRVNPPSCDCPPYTLSEIENICTNCQNAYLQAQFTDQLDDIVVNFTNKLSSQTQLCKLIFQTNTLNLLGDNPICNVDQEYLIISLGNNAQINIFSPLIFKQDSLKFEGCSKFIQSYQNNLVYSPSQQLTPQINLNFPNEVFYYQKSQLQITQQLINGKRDLKLLNWRIDPNQNIDIPSEVESVLEDLNTQLANYQFSFKQISLAFSAKITFQLLYQNFLGQQGSTDLIVNFNRSQDQLLVNFHSPLGIPFYINNSYNLIFEPYLFDLQQQKQVDKVIFVQLDLQLMLADTVVDRLTLNGKTEQYFNYRMNTTNFKSSNRYYLLITFKDLQNSTLSATRKQISIQEQEPFLAIIGGNRSISNNSQNQIKAVLYNLTLTNFTFQWSCINIIDSSYCINSDGSNLQLDQTNLTLYDDSSQALVILQIPAHTFNAYQTVQLVLSIHFNDYVIEDSIIIIVEEDAIPQIDIISHNFKQKYNYYDQLYFRFKYDVTNINTDLLTFIGTIYQDHQILHQQKYLYLEITLSLWQFILDNPESLIFKFTVFNPNYIKTSSINIKLLLNKPPTNCQIQLNAQTGRSLQDDIEVKIKNCIDDDQPLMYRYVIYKSKQDYQTDQMDSIVKKGRIISHYSYSSSLSFQLPGIDETYFLIMVQDSNFGITNLTQTFTNTAPNIDHNQRYSSYLSDLNQSNLLMKTHLILLDMEEFNYYDSTTLTTLKNELNDMQSTDITRTQLQEIHYLINQIQVKSNTTLTATELNSQLRQINYSCELIYANMSKVINNSAKNSIQSQNKQDKEELYQQFEILNNLIKLNNQVSVKQYRILEDSLSNKELIFNSIYSINNSTLIQQVINGPNSIMNGSEIQIINAKLSALQTKQQMNLSNVNESISFSQQYYQDNPYAQDQDFQEFKEQYQSNGYPLYAAQISNLNTTSASLSNYSINYTFDLQKSIQELELQCTSLHNQTWTASLCQTEKQQNNTILCICKSLSPTTILEAAKKISQDLLSLFTLDAVQQIGQHDYIKEIFIYIIIIETTFYIWGIFQGKKLDKIKDTKANFPKVYPQQQHQTEGIAAEVQTSDQRSERIFKTERTGRRVLTPDIDEKFLQLRDLNIKFILHKSRFDVLTENQQLQSETAIMTVLTKSVSQTSIPKSQVSIGTNQSGVLVKIKQNDITLKKAFFNYLKLFHKILGIFYRYDPKLSRVTRLTLLYISFIGQIAIHAFFGQIFNLNTLLALSLLSFVFGTIYKRILVIGLQSENKFVYNATFNFAILSFLIFYYIILASIAKYKNEFDSIIWPITYLFNLCLDLCIYSLLIHLAVLLTFKKYGNIQILRTLGKIVLQSQELEFFYGEEGSPKSIEENKTII